MNRIAMPFRIASIVLAFSAAVVPAAVVASPGFNFGDPIQYPLADASAIAIGDVTGDGALELVVTTTGHAVESATRVLVYGRGVDGTLSPVASHQYAEWSNASTVALGDFDNDGLEDVVVGHDAGVDVLMFDAGAPTGAFELVELETAHDCRDVSTADVNLDEMPDIVCLEWSGDATVLHGDGQGGFPTRVTFATGAQGYNDLEIGDVNGDGHPDLVIASMQALQWHVYPHDGVSGFATTPTSFERPDDTWSASAVAIGDFNDDGRNDVAIGTWGNKPNSKVTLYYQGGTGTLGPPVDMPSRDLPQALFAEDVDQDGDTDLVVGHVSYGIGHYLQEDGTFAEEVVSSFLYQGFANGMAIGDVDGDGCIDAAAVDVASGFSVVLGQCPVAPYDFNGDGLSDLLWRNPTTGASAIWNGADITQRLPIRGVSNLAWQVAGVGDIDGDGLADVVWREGETGQNAAWLGGQIETPRNITKVTDTDWRIAGIGDLDGDGVDDLVWRHAVSGANTAWLAADASRSVALDAVTNTEWTIAAVADFDGDGADDLLWRNPVTGANTIWHSGDADDQDNIVDVRDTTWTIAGTGDFDADGRADILWRNTGNGRNVAWRGGQYDDQAPVRRVGDTNWQVGAIADYDGDGRDDIFWRHATTGRNVYWSAADSTVQVRVRGVTNLDWTVVP